MCKGSPLTMLTQWPQALPQGPAPGVLAHLGSTPSEGQLSQPPHGACVRCSPTYDPPRCPTASRQNPVWPRLTFLVPSHATCLYSSPRSHHTKLLRFPGKTLLFTFRILFRALPLPTGLGEAPMSPPWRTFAGSSAPDSFTCASPGTALTVL